MLKKILVLFLLVLTGCSQSYYMQGKSAAEKGLHDSAIENYYAELKVNPDNYKAWCELGVAFYNQGNLIKAEDAFKQANSMVPDARTNLYIGLLQEKKKQYDKAISAYAASLNMDGSGKTKKLIRAHLDRLISKKFTQEVSMVIENEAQINADTISPSTVAVVNFDGSQLSPELAPISLGLAEFTSIDLAKVSGLAVVDRLKIDMIQKELELSKSQYADPTYSPRIGRLLGSYRIITGSVLSTGDDGLRLDGAIVNTIDSSSLLTGATEGDLNRFFALQKAFVFRIIDTLGITLTKEERDAISEVPTESFVAFMAYCRGLNYQSLGMNDAARESFNQATEEDKDFTPAANQLASVARPSTTQEGGEGSGTGSFEAEVVSEMSSEEYGQRLDEMQRSHLSNSGFMYDRHNFDRFGHTPLAPPLGSDVRLPTTTVIIRGNFDGE